MEFLEGQPVTCDMRLLQNCEISWENATCDMWHATCDMWHATCDMWHATCEFLSQKNSAHWKFSPYKFGQYREKDRWSRRGRRFDHRSMYSCKRSEDQSNEVKGHKVEAKGQMSKGQMSNLLDEMMWNDYDRFPDLSYFCLLYPSYCIKTGIKQGFPVISSQFFILTIWPLWPLTLTLWPLTSWPWSCDLSLEFKLLWFYEFCVLPLGDWWSGVLPDLGRCDWNLPHKKLRVEISTSLGDLEHFVHFQDNF